MAALAEIEPPVTVRAANLPADYDDANAVLRTVGMGSANNIPLVRFIAEDSARVIGCAGVFPLNHLLPEADPDVAGIASVAVLRSYRRRGIGARLVNACVERALAGGYGREVWLETMFWNRGFYEGLGFEFVQAAAVPERLLALRQNKKCLFMVRKQPATRRVGNRKERP